MILGITTIQRDRAPYITEWIAFHYLVGFRKFYIYLNRCEDNTDAVVCRLSLKFDIKCTIIATPNKPQITAYQHAYYTYGHEVDWMAFIDADEFLFPVQSLSMENVLAEFNNIKLSAIALYSANFGSSGHVDDPPGLIIDNYKYRRKLSANKSVKSIVRGKQQVTCTSSHIFNTADGTFDEKLRPVNSPASEYEPSFEKLRINHYLLQSREYYIKHKQYAGAPDLDNGDDYIRGIDTVGIPALDWYWYHNDVNEEFDDSVNKYSADLNALVNDLKSSLRLDEVIDDRELYFQRHDLFKNQLLRCASIYSNLVVLDLRHEETLYKGNRFMIYSLFPQCNIFIHVCLEKQNTVFTISKSFIANKLNRGSTIDVDELCHGEGDGSHTAPRICQVTNDQAKTLLSELIAKIITKSGPLGKL